MDVQLYRLRVIKGKEAIAEEWLAFLKANKEGAEKLLENEKVYFEAYFKETTENQMFIYLFMMSKDHEFANNTAFSSSHELDKKHFEYIKACIDRSESNTMNAEVFMDNLKDKV